MDISEDQKDVLIKYYGNSLARAIIQTLEEDLIPTLYGAYPERQVSLEEIQSTLRKLTISFLKMEKQTKEFENKINSLENVIEPDKTDVHNINRRIELLAQRIAELESKKGWLRR